MPRTCIGCRSPDRPAEMVKIAAPVERSAEGGLTATLGGFLSGRGAWLHPRSECVKRAAPALPRALRSGVRVRPAELSALIRAAASRRAEALAAAAGRARGAVPAARVRELERCLGLMSFSSEVG
jgi:predicted RNA-binding protein YlxR (DUF448 family)